MNESGIFDITKDRLLPIVSNVASEKVDSFSIRFDHQKTSPNGIMGEYLIPTITCQTESGDSLEFTLFVRRRKRADEGRLQAHHYAFLSKNGVPIPRLYGVLSDSQGREVLFLEHLDEFAVSDDAFYEDTNTLIKYLEIMAKFNSVKPTVEYAADVGRDMADRDFTMNWKTWLPWSIYVLDHVEKYAEKHLLGEQIMRFCQSNQAEIKILKRIALKLIHVVPNLPVGLIHGDFLPGNMGWRRNPRELVVFDFEDILFDTRLYDIAFVLGGWDIEGKHSAKQHDLAEIYLNTYFHCGGSNIGIEDFIREITLVWYARKLNLWEYFPPDLLNAPSYESGMPGNTRQARLDLLYKNISMLVTKMDHIGSLIR